MVERLPIYRLSKLAYNAMSGAVGIQSHEVWLQTHPWAEEWPAAPRSHRTDCSRMTRPEMCLWNLEFGSEKSKLENLGQEWGTARRMNAPGKGAGLPCMVWIGVWRTRREAPSPRLWQEPLLLELWRVPARPLTEAYTEYTGLTPTHLRDVAVKGGTRLGRVRETHWEMREPGFVLFCLALLWFSVRERVEHISTVRRNCLV